MVRAKEWELSWMMTVVFYNLTAEFLTYGVWHYITHVLFWDDMKILKFNPDNQYLKFSSNLRREITFTTLGWLQSSVLQCIMLRCWATGQVDYIHSLWERPLFVVGSLLFVTYWREFHFYWVHRLMHPWKKSSYGLKEGDIGAFLYRHFHSLHHKSYNPGPFSGISMHPVEHFFYYTCAYLPFFITLHPLHFLYCLYHANISPIGGHDGLHYPGTGSTFHYIHHATYDCNYGVPELVDMDAVFGTLVNYEQYLKRKGTNK